VAELGEVFIIEPALARGAGDVRGAHDADRTCSGGGEVGETSVSLVRPDWEPVRPCDDAARSGLQPFAKHLNSEPITRFQKTHNLTQTFRRSL
jgi:hypothetical protein